MELYCMLLYNALTQYLETLCNNMRQAQPV